MCVCVGAGVGTGRDGITVSNNMMKLFSFFVVVVYCRFSYGTCTLFFLRVYVVSCHICITFLNMLPLFFVFSLLLRKCSEMLESAVSFCSLENSAVQKLSIIIFILVVKG